MNNATLTGLLTGLALGFAGYFGGFGALVVVAVMGAAGLLIGYLVRRDGYAAGLVRRRDDGREGSRLRGPYGERPGRRYEPRRPEGGARTRAPFTQRVE